ncbi:MAG TPA: asparagine synthase C-terminal domain-containing protein [Nitrososphaera sp.]|nr:asparagine synthase C-terminal domain-containing protein [Nitrososphaera sp.]
MQDSLRKALYEAVNRNAREDRIGVAFSGGIDSALLARICSDLGKEVVLITAGFPGSHDLEFSKSIAEKLRLPIHAVVIDSIEFQKQLQRIFGETSCRNTSHVENCLAYSFIARAANEQGLSVVLSANGCDELFCGYNGYRLVYENGVHAMLKLMDEKIANELELVREISAVAARFEVDVRQPFLDVEFIEFSKKIPIDEKIKGPDDMLRKHILREVALEVNVPPESAMKPKKALQYGSLIHKHYRKALKALGDIG